MIEKKNEVFIPFKIFKLLVEKEDEYDIKKLKINGEGEFTSNEFA